MLGNINLADKSYEDLLAEAIQQIPLYTKEWTNFNNSDPGITILQNLSAFTVLQQDTINLVTDAVRSRLLGLLGFEAGEHKAARVLLCEEKNRAVNLRAGEKLIAGGLCFEAENEISLSAWGISEIYTESNGAFKDITYLMTRNSKSGTSIFGTPAKNNNSFYCIFNERPLHGNSEMLMYVNVSNNGNRNPFEDDGLNFAEIEWQCYTDNGWESVEFTDETRGFLLSGAIRLTLPSYPIAFTGVPSPKSGSHLHGFALRCVLKSNCYDIPPQINSIAVNFFEAKQIETRAKSFIFHGAKNVEIKHCMADYGYFSVFGREEKKGAYRAYKRSSPYSAGQQGRFYTMSQSEDGTVRFEFSKKDFGYAPGQGFASVRIICYNEDTVHHFNLGKVEGYENQIINLEQTERVLPESFCLLAEADGNNEDDEKEYYFIEPNLTNPDYLCYTVQSEEGSIKITEPGFMDDCRLYICDLAVTAGGGGNIIAGNKFKSASVSDIEAFAGETSASPYILVNPAPGCGGISAETPEELRLQFLSVLKNTTAAVTAADYESLVLGTPGFCIHKVKAVYDPQKNVMRIAVKPYNNDELPKLSPVYSEHIKQWLDKRRMITTKIELCQPVYVPIDVHVSVYVKSYYQNADIEIKDFIKQALDGITTDVPFGAVVSYHSLFQGVEALPCVDSLYELNISTKAYQHTISEGIDIQLGSDALYYAGNISLDIITR